MSNLNSEGKKRNPVGLIHLQHLFFFFFSKTIKCAKKIFTNPKIPKLASHILILNLNN